MRPSWNGHLRLSLVSYPIGLVPATTEVERIKLNLGRNSPRRSEEIRNGDCRSGCWTVQGTQAGGTSGAMSEITSPTL